ncbi:MAG TPA: hypothetical protein VF796_02265 [Humisphaera sp.]
MSTLIGTARAIGQERYEMRPKLVPGLTATFAFEQSASSDSGSYSGERRSGTVRYTEVTGGLPAAARLVYGADTGNATTVNGTVLTSPHPLRGRTFAVRLEPGGRVSHDADEMTLGGQGMFFAELMKPEMRFHPPRPVALGDSWAPDPALMEFLGGPKGDYTCRLAKIGEYNGRPTFDITVSGKGSLDTGGGSRSDATISGSVQIDRQYGVIVHQDVTSKITHTSPSNTLRVTARRTVELTLGGRGAVAPATRPATRPTTNPASRPASR